MHCHLSLSHSSSPLLLCSMSPSLSQSLNFFSRKSPLIGDAHVGTHALSMKWYHVQGSRLSSEPTLKLNLTLFFSSPPPLLFLLNSLEFLANVHIYLFCVHVWCLCECMYVYLYTIMCSCACVHVFLCVPLCVLTCLHVCVFVHMLIYACLSLSMHIFVYVFLFVCVCPSICVYPFLFVFVCFFMSTSLCVYHHWKNTLPMVLNVCVCLCNSQCIQVSSLYLCRTMPLSANMFMCMCKFLWFYVHLCVCMCVIQCFYVHVCLNVYVCVYTSVCACDILFINTVATPLWAKCEGEAHTPKSGKLESSGTPKNSERDCRGQISSHLSALNVIKKVLKCRCPKWPRIGHLDIFNPSYEQKKGWESNCQFDCRPLKVGNRPVPDVRSGSVTWRWKPLSSRATSLVQTSSQSEVGARSYEVSKSWESKPG